MCGVRTSPVLDVVLAVDIGGTRIKAALVDADLRTVVATTVATPPEPTTQIVASVSDVRADLLEMARTGAGDGVRVVASAAVAPGIIDEAAGRVVFAVNLGFRDLPLADLLSAALQTPVRLGHDVRAGLLAEARIGAARGARNVLFAPLGTGIAGALLIDGRLLGADGWAGELGHVVVLPGGRPCSCGNTGCLETISSATALERSYEELSGRRVSARELGSLVAQDDPLATQVWQTGADALGFALANAVSLTGVELVVLGGGLVGSGETLLAPVRAALERDLSFQRRPRVVAAELGDRAGCLGAAILSWQTR